MKIWQKFLHYLQKFLRRLQKFFSSCWKFSENSFFAYKNSFVVYKSCFPVSTEGLEDCSNPQLNSRKDRQHNIFIYLFIFVKIKWTGKKLNIHLLGELPLQTQVCYFVYECVLSLRLLKYCYGANKSARWSEPFLTTPLVHARAL